MKIGELDQHCGNCKVIGFCGEPYNEICLCCSSDLENVEEQKYIEFAETSKRHSKKAIMNDVIRKLQKV